MTKVLGLIGIFASAIYTVATGAKRGALDMLGNLHHASCVIVLVAGLFWIGLNIAEKRMTQRGEARWLTIAKMARRTLSGCIAITGAIAFVPYLLLLGFLSYVLLQSLLWNPIQDVTSPGCQDFARSILRSCNIGEERLKKVHYGYESMPDPHGDGSGAYVFEITDVDVSELTPERGWTRGDQASGALENEIRSLIGMYGSEGAKWFPNAQEVKSADIFVCPLPRHTFSLVLVRLSDRMVFYAYFQT